MNYLEDKINTTSERKKDHIDLCLNESVVFNNKTNGFDKYHFDHFAATEIDYNEIDLSSKFFGKKITYPFLISCMTGGTDEANAINANLAVIANETGIPIGVGSQRQALENSSFHKSYKVIRQNAKSVPVLGNIGAAQISELKHNDSIKFLIDLVEADAMVIHLNAAQEVVQEKGEPNFKGLLKKINKLTKEISIPFIVKEVGAGINKKSAKLLLDNGIRGIDVAGAGGTSWTAVEFKRNNSPNENELWNWGLPTTYCIKEVNKLKKKYYFTLIASGGITNGFEIAKALIFGADITASARPILISVVNNGIEKTINEIHYMFENVKKVMYLNGASNIKELKKCRLIKTEDIY